MVLLFYIKIVAIRLEAQQRAVSQAYGGPSLLDMEEAMDVGHSLRGGFPQRQLRDDLINIPRVLRLVIVNVATN